MPTATARWLAPTILSIFFVLATASWVKQYILFSL